MNKDLQIALAHFRSTGPGEDLPKEDVDAVHEFMISTLAGTGMDTLDAIRLVMLLEQGSWVAGWNKGYASAREYYGKKV